jgi:hypothetical protein
MWPDEQDKTFLGNNFEVINVRLMLGCNIKTACIFIICTYTVFPVAHELPFWMDIQMFTTSTVQ